MSTIVLLHGAWHASWCWQKVAPLLEQHGHDVLCPDLPGHRPDDAQLVTLEIYTEFVADLLSEIETPVVLVGHSMAGIILSQVAEQFPEKIKSLVYLTAYLLADGQSMLEMAQRDREGLVLPNLVFSRDRKKATVKSSIVRDAFYHDCEETDYQCAMDKLIAQSLAPLSTTVHVSEGNWGRIPRHYIECCQDRAITIDIQRVMWQRHPCETVISLQSGHSPFYSAPVLLAEQIHQLSIK